ncbi:CD151 antigen-like [Bolinopsis microptera]|uniref:CD151 antigen-like n=1 Tax=Bolinopsis microptera TaxID=2820187 RepID=UPI0030792D69
MNVYETTSLDRYGRSSLAPIREDKELEGLKKKDYVLLAVGAVFTIGAVILCVSSLGLYGAMKPNVCVLTLYLVAVIPALVGELAFCSIAWFRQATLKKLLDDLMKTLFAHYGDRAESLGLTATLILDAVQIWGGCCGNSTVSDWGDLEVATFWANSTNKPSEYPDSCCNKTTITDSTVDTTLPILDSYFHNCSQNTVANFLPDYFNNKVIKLSEN